MLFFRILISSLCDKTVSVVHNFNWLVIAINVYAVDKCMTQLEVLPNLRLGNLTINSYKACGLVPTNSHQVF